MLLFINTLYKIIHIAILASFPNFRNKLKFNKIQLETHKIATHMATYFIVFQLIDKEPQPSIRKIHDRLGADYSD